MDGWKWLVACARCKRVVLERNTRLLWNPALGAYRLCRTCYREVAP